MNEKLSARTKWSYCIGATGRDAAYALVSMYLMLYVQYTMNLTPLQFGVISGAMVCCMVWDAVNDLLMGVIIENCNLRMGKFKPWILLGAVLNAIIIVCLFTIRPTGWAFVAYYSICYLLWGMTFTMNDIAYWGVLPSLSSDPKTRDSLVTWMSIFVCIGQFSVAGVVPVIIAGNAVRAYRMTALVIAIALVLFQMLTAFGIEENPRSTEKKSLSVKDMFHVFARNDQLVFAGIASLLFNVGFNLLILFGVNFFYIEYGYEKSGNLIFLFTVMYGLGMLISQSMYAQINRLFTRRQVMNFAMAVLSAGYVMLFLFGYVLPKNVILLNAIGFIIFNAQGLMNLCIVIMINNTIEYDEYHFGERHDSVISAVRSFSVKLAGGINQALSTLVLLVSGIYAVSRGISALETEAGKGLIDQTTVIAGAEEYLSSVTFLQGITFRACMVLIPLVTLAASYFILRRKYHIDEVMYEDLLKKNAQRSVNRIDHDTEE